MFAAVGTTASQRSDVAVVASAEAGYEEWLTRTVDGMPELTERQQRDLRDLLRP